ncbi:AI-2E family transporter [uncultured archaeon]|nr:AI-2E family transporter [uncultured archaeon]
MDEAYFRKATTIAILGVLIVLSFFMLKPLLLSIIGGFILAFIFSPLYNKLFKWTKSRTLSAMIICTSLLLLILAFIWFFTPTIVNESIKIYRASQQLNVVDLLKKVLPFLFNSQESSQQFGSIIQTFITKITNSLMNYFSNLILDFPTILLKIFVVFFTFYYALRDRDKLTDYIKNLLPFSDDVVKKLFTSTRDITTSVLFGQVIIGVVQALILAAGFFIFGVPNAWVLSIVAIVGCILPIIGPTFIGLPVAVFLLIAGNTFSAAGVIVFTVLSHLSDHVTRPLFVAKRAKLHTAIALIGMIGGFLLFGVLGFVLGPLIIAYLIIIIEIYKNKSSPGLLIQKA